MYNILTDTLNPIVLSLNVANHYAFSAIIGLDESGLAVGTYRLFDEFGDTLGDRAFAWTPAAGAFDLGLAIEGGLTAANWDALKSANYANGLGMIGGVGTLSGDHGDGPYLLRSVPEPGACFFLVLGIVFTATARLRITRVTGN